MVFRLVYLFKNIRNSFFKELTMKFQENKVFIKK